MVTIANIIKEKNDEIALWRIPLQRALHRNRSQINSRYFQLATIDQTGLPTNRTVVFRGFLEHSNYLKIITDTRSEKFNHLKSNPVGEICWYFAKTREQFRLTGTIALVTENNSHFETARTQTWKSLSDKAKEQFFWASPGKQLDPHFDDRNFFIDQKNPVTNFCLLLFDTQKVDHLQLKGNPQNRYLYTLNDDHQWQLTQINP